MDRYWMHIVNHTHLYICRSVHLFSKAINQTVRKCGHEAATGLSGRSAQLEYDEFSGRAALRLLFSSWAKNAWENAKSKNDTPTVQLRGRHTTILFEIKAANARTMKQICNMHHRLDWVRLKAINWEYFFSQRQIMPVLNISVCL